VRALESIAPEAVTALLLLAFVAVVVQLWNVHVKSSPDELDH